MKRYWKKFLERCMLHRAQRIKLPEADNKKECNKVKPTKTEYQLGLPFVIYADLKSVLPKRDSCGPSSSKSFISQYQHHVPSETCIHVKYSDGQYFELSQVNIEDGAAEKFLEQVLVVATICRQYLTNNIPIKRLIQEQWKEWNNATNCWICSEPFKSTEKKVWNHDYLMIEYRGPAHNTCNLNYCFHVSFCLISKLFSLAKLIFNFASRRWIFLTFVNNFWYQEKRHGCGHSSCKHCELNLYIHPSNVRGRRLFYLLIWMVNANQAVGGIVVFLLLFLNQHFHNDIIGQVLYTDGCHDQDLLQKLFSSAILYIYLHLLALTLMLFWCSNLSISFMSTGYLTPDMFNSLSYSWHFVTLSGWFLLCTGCNDAKMDHRKHFSLLFWISRHPRFPLSSLKKNFIKKCKFRWKKVTA